MERPLISELTEYIVYVGLYFSVITHCAYLLRRHRRLRIEFFGLFAILLIILPAQLHAATITLNSCETHTYTGCGNDNNCLDIQSGPATIRYTGGCPKNVVASGATMSIAGDIITQITSVSGIFKIAGNVDLNGGSRTITSTGSGVTRFNGVISNGALILQDTDSVSSNSHIYLARCNTYTGGTIILGGEIKHQSNNAYGSGDISICGDARLVVNSGATIPNNININADLAFYFHSTSGTTSTTGTITINTGGTLQNDSTYLNASGSNVDLNGGTLNTNNEAMTINSLTLSDNSTINLGSTETFTIGDSSGFAWTAGKTLTINNWAGAPGGPSTGSTILVGAGFFTAAQLAEIEFFSFPKGAAIVGGELVPAIVVVPEPSTWLSGTWLMLLTLWHRRWRMMRFSL